MSKIMAELLKAADMKAPKGDPDQAFLLRLRKHADAAFDEDEALWESLSKEAQSWFNEAATSVKNKKDIAVFSDLAKPAKAEKPATKKAAVVEEDEDPAPEEVADDDEGDDDVKKPAKKGAVAKKAAAPAKKAVGKKAAAPPAKKANGEKPKKSMLRALREMVCGKPELTTEQLTKKLDSAGYKVSAMTVGTLRSDCRNTLKIAQEMGVVLKGLDFDA
jgi:hypothetical protein